MKYIKVYWPESQQFIGCSEAYFVDCDTSSTYFVEESLYEFGKKNPNVYGEDLDQLLEGSLLTIENYPIQDPMWPSRRWNSEMTDYIDLSGENEG